MQPRPPIRLRLDPDAPADAPGFYPSDRLITLGIALADHSVEMRLGRLLGVEAGGVRLLPGGPDTAVDAVLMTLLQPGDVVVAVINGPLSAALAERATRMGVEVIVVEHGSAEAIELPRIEAALWARGARLCLSVHADPATGAADDPAPICALAREHGAMAVVDCRATLGAAVVNAQAWGAQAVCAGGAGLGAPDVAIVGLGPDALAAMSARRTPPFAWTLDLSCEGVGGGRAPLSSRLHEALATLEEAGPEAVRRRGASLRDGLAAGLSAMGLALGARTAPALVAAVAPSGVDVERTRRRMRQSFGVEVGVLEAARGWRCSLLAPGFTPSDIRLTLAAFYDALANEGLPSDFHAALAAANLLMPDA